MTATTVDVDLDERTVAALQEAVAERCDATWIALAVDMVTVIGSQRCSQAADWFLRAHCTQCGERFRTLACEPHRAANAFVCDHCPGDVAIDYAEPLR